MKRKTVRGFRLIKTWNGIHTRDGCVIEVSDGTIIYEPIENIPAEAIANAMNELAAEGVIREWDWKHVERRLFEQGVIKECRA